MSVTEAEIKLKLAKLIQKWSEEVCEDADTFWGDRTVELMTDAAFGVYLAGKNVYQTAVRDGYWV